MHSFCVFSSEQLQQWVLSKHPKSAEAHFRAIEFYPLGRRRAAIFAMIDLSVMNSWRPIKIFGREKSMRDFLPFRFAVTNALFSSLHGLLVVPVPLSTPPVPLRKARARHERQFKWPHQRLASVCGSAAALHSGSVPAVSSPALHFPRSPTADRSHVKIAHSASRIHFSHFPIQSVVN